MHQSPTMFKHLGHNLSPKHLFPICRQMRLLILVAWISFVFSERFDVTLVSQASSDRLWMVEELCKRWHGPIALAIFVPLSKFGNDTSSSSAALGQVQTLCGTRLTYSVHKASSIVELTDYPVNVLRNKALDLVRTSHLLTIDIDFCPSTGLYDEILTHAKLHQSNPKLASVVPAFQRHGSSCSSIEKCKALACVSHFLPSDISELNQCIVAKNCIVFQADNNIEGHSTTQSSEWLRLSPMWSGPQPLSCIKSSRYEPYLVLNVLEAPRYDERFFGYGKNKIQYIQHLRFAGFKFAVLPREFLIHTPHPKSAAKVHWLSDRQTHSKVDAQYLRFMNDLAKKYKTPPTPICRGGHR
jgi:hypothetical protein